MANNSSADERRRAIELRRGVYADDAPKYDAQMRLVERTLFGPQHRAWACSQATGQTLEVAIGTGLNLLHYPREVQLAGLDLSPEMLAIARTRAAELARPIALVEGDAEELPFGDATFETVVCTYSLCGVSDVDRTVAEMKRVLRRGGRLLLVDHIESAVKPILWLQRLLELVTSRREGEYFTRRPLLNVKAAGFEILARDRLRAGVIERVVALRTDG